MGACRTRTRHASRALIPAPPRVLMVYSLLEGSSKGSHWGASFTTSSPLTGLGPSRHRVWAVDKRPRRGFFGLSGGFSGPSGSPFRRRSDPVCTVLEASGALLGSCGPSSGMFGPFRCHVGNILGRLGAISWASCAVLGGREPWYPSCASNIIAVLSRRSHAMKP